MVRRLSLFGATGTIGDNTLDLVTQHHDLFDVAILSAHTNTDKLAELARRFHPDCLVIGSEGGRAKLQRLLPDFTGEILVGADGLLQAARHKVDVAVMAIVGFAGLAPALACAEQGGLLALANKEALVAAGSLLMQTASAHQTIILPVDSEHNAIFQLLSTQKSAQKGAKHDCKGAQHGAKTDKKIDKKIDKEIDKIILTASGGPFRTWSRDEMASATPAQAVTHPNWDMGAKISVDSATLMNKGLELVEAHHLFAIAPDQLDVLVHRQSIVHGLVYFSDGSVLAQKANPDMRVPLAYCMAYPERVSTGVAPLDLVAAGRLDFEAADRKRFPCLALAEAGLRQGGAAPIVLNAANEVAVAGFLQQRCGFLDIGELVAEALQQADMGEVSDLASIVAVDEKTRQTVEKLLQSRVAS